MKRVICIPIILTILLASCNKDTLNTEDNTTRQKLVGKNWELVQMGEDANGNGVPDDNGIPGNNELKYTDSSVSLIFMLNDNGSGTITFANADTSGSTNLTWTIDPSETYVTSTVPAFAKTIVSRIITITNSSITGVIDTSENPKRFVYFLREGFR